MDIGDVGPVPFFVSDGNVYIKTYSRKKDLEEYIILDLKGNIRMEVFLPKATYNLFTFMSLYMKEL